MENFDPIYVITTLEKCEPDERYWVQLGCTRPVGFRHDLKSAQETVEANMCDIWEYCYDYAVIEEVEPALYPYSKPRWFYKFNRENGRYEPIEEPECVKHIVNFALG